MYNLWHIDPLCMFCRYVILIWNLSHRSTVYSGSYAIFRWHGSTVYDWCPWPMSIMSSVCDLSMGMPTSELIYMIFYRCLVVRRFSIICAPNSRHTHATYKVYRLSLVSNLILSGAFYYPWFWSSWWCMDDGVLSLFIRTFSWEKLLSSLSRNIIFKGSSQAASIFACENAWFS